MIADWKHNVMVEYPQIGVHVDADFKQNDVPAGTEAIRRLAEVLLKATSKGGA